MSDENDTEESAGVEHTPMCYYVRNDPTTRQCKKNMDQSCLGEICLRSQAARTRFEHREEQGKLSLSVNYHT